LSGSTANGPGAASAGGIGGLVEVIHYNGVDGNGAPVVSAAYWPVYDDKGNVVALVDSGVGTGHTQGIVASIEYSPFGEVAAVDGAPGSGIDISTIADFCPFLFSTKYAEPSVGLYYYGERYYEPGVGKWLNRDPLEEEGGLNLYAFCGNDPVNAVDPTGLFWGETWDCVKGWYAAQADSAIGILSFTPVQTYYALKVCFAQAEANCWSVRSRTATRRGGCDERTCEAIPTFSSDCWCM
jgi:RHS repeat-associated protein